jgi:hypothetical protein
MVRFSYIYAEFTLLSRVLCVKEHVLRLLFLIHTVYPADADNKVQGVEIHTLRAFWIMVSASIFYVDC